MAGVYSYRARCSPTLVDEASTLLLNENPTRLRLAVQNTLGIMYVKLGINCTPLSYSYRLPQRAILEVEYQGVLTACVPEGTGFCNVTETV